MSAYPDGFRTINHHAICDDCWETATEFVGRRCMSCHDARPVTCCEIDEDESDGGADEIAAAA